MAETLPTPENSRPNRVASAIEQSQHRRVRRVANASHKWSELVRRKHHSPTAELRPKPSITTFQLMEWVGKAVNRAHSYLVQRRKTPYDPTNRVINRDRGATPNVQKWRQLSKPFRRYLRHNVPER